MSDVPLDLDAITARTEVTAAAPSMEQQRDYWMEKWDAAWTELNAERAVVFQLRNQLAGTIKLDLHNALIEQERRNAQAQLANTEAQWRKATLLEREERQAAEEEVSRLRNQVRELEDALEDGQRLRDQLAERDVTIAQLRQENRDLELALYTIANQRRRDDLVDQALRRPLLKAATEEVSRLRDQLAESHASNLSMAASLSGLADRIVNLEGVVARITDELKKLHGPYPMYDECEHDDCLEAWEADNGVIVCGDVTRHVCDTCRDEDGEPSEYPCETARAVLGEQIDAFAEDGEQTRHGTKQPSRH